MKRMSGSRALSRKEREKHAHEQDILESARELFARKGYHNTTLEEIARQAEFGKGTIYNYFDSKEDLFYGIIDQLTDEVLRLAQSSITNSYGNVRDVFANYGRVMISHARDNSDLFHLIFREIGRLESEEYEAKLKQLQTRARKVWGILAQPLETEMRAGRIAKGDPLKLVELYDGMLRFYCLNRFGRSLSSVDHEIDDAVRFVTTIFFDGIVERKSKG